MKFNWGTGIFIFYSLFALALITMVYKSTQYDNSLVVEDYYAQDLAYQKIFDKKQNSLSLKQATQIKYNSGSNELSIQFSDDYSSPTGTLMFYRPDNKILDKKISIKTDPSGRMIIPTNDLIAGYWKVKVDWAAGGKNFLDISSFHK